MPGRAEEAGQRVICGTSCNRASMIRARPRHRLNITRHAGHGFSTPWRTSAQRSEIGYGALGSRRHAVGGNGPPELSPHSGARCRQKKASRRGQADNRSGEGGKRCMRRTSRPANMEAAHPQRADQRQERRRHDQDRDRGNQPRRMRLHRIPDQQKADHQHGERSSPPRQRRSLGLETRIPRHGVTWAKAERRALSRCSRPWCSGRPSPIPPPAAAHVALQSHETSTAGRRLSPSRLPGK